MPVSGPTKTTYLFVSGIDSLFSGFSHIDDDFYEELEEIPHHEISSRELQRVSSRSAEEGEGAAHQGVG